MPLPKSSSIAAKATEVYSEVWSVIQQHLWSMPPSREDDLSDLSCLLPYLRQLLTCCACAGLLEDAMISLSCGHCYCSKCQHGDPLLKIQCRQCRDRTGLVTEGQLRILVKCYKHVCCIIADSVRADPVLLGNLSNIRDNASNKVEALDNENVNVKSPKIDNRDKISSKNSKALVDIEPETNPIVEILREIQEGVKVSRAVLVVKPPLKYLNSKVSVTPKKDQHPTTPAASTGQKPTPKRASNLKSKISATQKSSTSTARDTTGPDVRMSTSALISHRISGLRSKGRSGRKNLLRSKHALSSGEESLRKRHRIEPRGYKTEVSTEEEEVDVLSVSETSGRLATVTDMVQAKLTLDSFQPELFNVSLSCLDEGYLDITPDGATLKQNGEPGAGERVVVSNGNFKQRQLHFRRTSDGRRVRVWDHMCPSVKVKRNQTVIDKTIHQQIKLARGSARTVKKRKVTKPSNVVHPKPQPPPEPPITPYRSELPIEYEPPLPDDLSGIILDKLEYDSPLPYPIDRPLFHTPPIYPPFPSLSPHLAASQSPIFGPIHQDPNYPIVMNAVPPLKQPFPTVTKSPSTPKKRRTPGYSEDGWRCRCGTNNVMFPEKVCAKGKCPCFSKGIPCKNCLCRQCHNPHNI